MLWRHVMASVCGGDVASYSFYCLEAMPSIQVYVASNCGEMSLIPATGWHGSVSRTRAHERLWLNDGQVLQK